jgi:hypothetical protein
VLPAHYDAFKMIETDTEAFAEDVEPGGCIIPLSRVLGPVAGCLVLPACCRFLIPLVAG